MYFLSSKFTNFYALACDEFRVEKKGNGKKIKKSKKKKSTDTHRMKNCNFLLLSFSHQLLLFDTL